MSGDAWELISNDETSTGKDKQANARKRKEVNRNAVEEWKEKRLMRMDEALTKIDEVLGDMEALEGIPHLIIATASIKNEESRKKATKSLVSLYGILDGRIKRIDALVNEGMTVPEDEHE